MANIQEFIDYVNRISPIIESEIIKVDNEIKEKNNNILELTNGLKTITQEIIDTENEKKNIQTKLDNYNDKKAKIESNIKQLGEEIDKSQKEADKLQKEIDDYNKMIEKLEAINPLAGILADKVIELKGMWKGVLDKIDSLNDEVAKSKKELKSSKNEENQIDLEIETANALNAKVKTENDQLTIQLKQIGNEKTAAEDFLLSLKNFKSKIESIADTIKLGKEFKDESIVSKQNIQDEIKVTYTKYNRQIPSGFLE